MPLVMVRSGSHVAIGSGAGGAGEVDGDVLLGPRARCVRRAVGVAVGHRDRQHRGRRDGGRCRRRCRRQVAVVGRQDQRRAGAGDRAAAEVGAHRVRAGGQGLRRQRGDARAVGRDGADHLGRPRRARTRPTCRPTVGRPRVRVAVKPPDVPATDAVGPARTSEVAALVTENACESLAERYCAVGLELTWAV